MRRRRHVLRTRGDTKRWRATLIVLAMSLAAFSIVYCLIESGVSIAFGASTADSRTLLEFGSDSLIEDGRRIVLMRYDSFS